MNPTRSAKSTVTTFRSSRGPLTVSPITAPHSEQNFACAWFSCPQAGQRLTTRSVRPRRAGGRPRGGRLLETLSPGSIKPGLNGFEGTGYGESPRDSDHSVVSLQPRTKHTRPVRALVADPRLDVLTQLGHRLPRTRSPEEAAHEVTGALAALEMAAIVSAVEFDIAVVISMHVPPGLKARLSPQMAASVVGMRLPLDGVESLRQPVRLRRVYFGPAAASETLRRLTTDSALAKALPNATDERDVLAVPVTCRDRVVAVISVWGTGCGPAFGPVLEVVAAMLAAAWSSEAPPAVGRFDAIASATPDTELRGIIDELLAGGRIVSALQPIVRLVNETVIGYEALARYPPLSESRPRTSSSHPPQRWTCSPRWTSRASALRSAPRPNIGEADLFVNVLIGTLVDQRGVAALDKAVHDARVDPASIVLEFSEREPVPDLALLQRIAAELRARGFRIAVDDAGAGHASMRVIAELRPEFIKVDRSLIQAVDSDRARRALVVAMLSFSGHIGARVIAEGIETDRERETLMSLGVQFGQGWLLGRPVLMHELEGNNEEVVDPTWFARRQVSPTRVGTTSPDAPEPDAMVAEPVHGRPARPWSCPRAQRRGARAPERARSRCGSSASWPIR